MELFDQLKEFMTDVRTKLEKMTEAQETMQTTLESFDARLEALENPGHDATLPKQLGEKQEYTTVVSG